MSPEPPAAQRLRVGILGLGRMGSAMAARLARQGHAVSGWTRSGIAPGKARDLGLAPGPDIAAVSNASDIILLSLSDDAAVTGVIGQLCRGGLTGKVVVDTSTVAPDTLPRQADAIRQAGGGALDAPISGGPDLVAEGKAGLYRAAMRPMSPASCRSRRPCRTAFITSARWAWARPPRSSTT